MIQHFSILSIPHVLIRLLVSCMHLDLCCHKLSIIIKLTFCIPVGIIDVQYVRPSKAFGLVSDAFHENMYVGWFAIEFMFKWGDNLVICLDVRCVAVVQKCIASSWSQCECRWYRSSLSYSLGWRLSLGLHTLPLPLRHSP